MTWYSELTRLKKPFQSWVDTQEDLKTIIFAMGDNDTRRNVYAILDFLQDEYNKSSTSADSKESIEVAMQCLETAFGVNLKDVQYKPKVTLRNALSESQRSGASTSTSQPQTSSAETRPGLNGEPYTVPNEATEEAQKAADTLKNLGNEKMKEGMFEEARQLYDKAIELDGRNAVYFCNRAAAFLKLEDTDKALRDCQIAIQLQPNYARAYGRMGVIYSSLMQHVKAAECYRKASQLDPLNESYVNNLKVAEEWADANEDNPGGAAGGAAAAAAGQAPNFQAIFSDPNLINMATQMLQNPNMLQMLRSFMSGFQNAAPTDAAAGGGGPQTMDGLLQMGQAIAQQIRAANPNLADQLGSQLGNQGPRSSPHGDSYDL
ncbi:unnamed protein product [Allacma fusca]|uniref:SGTA homodimerisation domain-containing protein n=1 Tax=Allacma fusca TaxID=39272 RepID=A0A8J2KFW7_9HEXA|nr:unnamed protein product [Allacma fusca]